jgi:hypothetical protein
MLSSRAYQRGVPTPDPSSVRTGAALHGCAERKCGRGCKPSEGGHEKLSHHVSLPAACLRGELWRSWGRLQHSPRTLGGMRIACCGEGRSEAAKEENANDDAPSAACGQEDDEHSDQRGTDCRADVGTPPAPRVPGRFKCLAILALPSGFDAVSVAARPLRGCVAGRRSRFPRASIVFFLLPGCAIGRWPRSPRGTGSSRPTGPARSTASAEALPAQRSIRWSVL